MVTQVSLVGRGIAETLVFQVGPALQVGQVTQAFPAGPAILVTQVPQV